MNKEYFKEIIIVNMCCYVLASIILKLSIIYTFHQIRFLNKHSSRLLICIVGYKLVRVVAFVPIIIISSLFHCFIIDLDFEAD